MIKKINNKLLEVFDDTKFEPIIVAESITTESKLLVKNNSGTEGSRTWIDKPWTWYGNYQENIVLELIYSESNWIGKGKLKMTCPE